MKKVILIVTLLLLIVIGCSNKSQDTDINDQQIVNIKEEDSIMEEPNEQQTNIKEIDRSEYFTGEIITDGNYFISEYGYGGIWFVPDIESREIIQDKYDESGLFFLNDESYYLNYDNISVAENLPNELGIYKVKVKFDVKSDSYKKFNIIDIQLTDSIGTVYEGKTYNTNNLDFEVKVKDRVCGLIVNFVDRMEKEGIRIGFTGEIETEGYYNISYSEMYDSNFGKIYYDEKSSDNVPIFNGERAQSDFYFTGKEELFNELEGFSSFGRGKFKTSNFILIYNYGIERAPSDVLTEIISLDENYKDMFVINDKDSPYVKGYTDDFAILAYIKYEDGIYPSTLDYYYINTNNPEKTFMFTTGYYYDLKEAINENEFILSSNGYNVETGYDDKPHEIKCIIENQSVIVEQ